MAKPKIPKDIPVVKRKELIDLVSQQAGYFKYEVEDILLALEFVVQKILSEGHAFQIGDMMKIAPVDVKQIKYHNPVTRVIGITPPKKTLAVSTNASAQRIIDQLLIQKEE